MTLKNTCGARTYFWEYLLKPPLLDVPLMAPAR